mgnify:CR=1 FL=1
MSKELEALLDLKKEALKDIDFSPHTIDELDIREKRIKINEKIIKNYNIVETALKALVIIQDKKVDVPYIIENPEEKDVIWYNSRFMGVLCEGWRMLSEEEYDSVREVLL